MTVSIDHRGYGGDVVITYRILNIWPLLRNLAGCRRCEAAPAPGSPRSPGLRPRVTCRFLCHRPRFMDSSARGLNGDDLADDGGIGACGYDCIFQTLASMSEHRFKREATRGRRRRRCGDARAGGPGQDRDFVELAVTRRLAHVSATVIRPGLGGVRFDERLRYSSED